MSQQEALSSIRRGNGQMVLILEDDRERLLRHEEIIAAFGYEPVGFTRAGEAVSVLARSLSRVDAAVVCHRRSASEALESAAALHRTAPDVPIILATASAGELGAHALAAAGVSEIVRQPLASSELADVLARCVRVAPPMLQIAAVGRSN
jgi:DNA-binding NtrC family response regulator